MNKITNAKRSKYIKFKKIDNIEELVDEILLKNKDKLEKIQKKEINIENFSLKNKKGNTLYYLRKKTSKKTKKSTSSDVLSKKIITEARSNLGEELPEFEKIEESDEIPKDKKIKIHKKQLKFDKKNKEVDDTYDAKPPTTEDLIKSKDFEEVVSETDEIFENKIQIQTDEDAKILDEKIMESPKIDDSGKKEDAAEVKVAELAEKHDFFSKEKKSEIKEQKDKDQLPISTDDLDELKKKYDENITITNSDLADTNKLDLTEPELMDEKNKDASVSKHQEEKKIESIEKKGVSKIKKSFFKKIVPSFYKPVDLGKMEVKSDRLGGKPVFRVDRISEVDVDKDEVGLVDEKIKDAPKVVDDSGKEDKGEIKAFDLAKEHLKDRPVPITKNEQSVEKKVKADIEIPLGVPLTEGDSDHEHVFFNEEEPSFTGWSPQITEREKRKISLPLSAQGEIQPDDLKAVGDIELPKEVIQTKSVKLSDLGFSEKEWEELDFYPLYEPFAYVEILREKESLDKCYFLVEIELSEKEENLLGFIRDTLHTVDIDAFDLEEKSEDEYLQEQLDEVIKEYNVDIDEDSKNKIFYYMGKSSLGLGKIDPLMRDPNIEDISCDGADVPVFLYHRKYGSLKSNIRFTDEDELSSFVFKLAQKCGKHISIAEPMLDATMPDGSRIQMTLSDEITAKGSTFTIRKFRSDPFSPPDLVEFNTMSPEMIAYFWLAIENGINTLFAGGTASGKTTTLNALSLFIPRESKVVSIEETREINLPHPNWIPGVARSGFGEIVADKVVGEIDMYDLMKAALRQRPEYIIVGEIRGKEAYVLFQAMATGHATYSTVHADSAQSLIHRLEGKPINIPRIMLQSLDIVCLHVITRVKNIRARRCKQVIEIIDIDPTTKEILTNEVFRWDPVEDEFIYSGKSYVLERVRAEKDLTREEMTEEIKNRKKIVEWMNTNNIREFRDVAKIVTQYYEEPVELLKQIEKGVKK